MICSMSKAAFEIKDFMFPIPSLRKAVFRAGGQETDWPIVRNLAKRMHNRRDRLLLRNAFEQPGIKRVKLCCA